MCVVLFLLFSNYENNMFSTNTTRSMNTINNKKKSHFVIVDMRWNFYTNIAWILHDVETKR